jgi:purine-nucleoside phosphorylase
VIGNKGNLIVGLINNIPVVCMQGRFHTFEGYSSAFCCIPIKLFKVLGIRTVVLTCKASAINQSYQVGDIMLIKDHLAPLLWTLNNPLVGHNDERFGPRFPAINRTYTRSLRTLFHEVANESGVPLREGIFSLLGGPNHQTATEMKGLQKLGTDVIGASTANEAIVASYCGLDVLGLALIEHKLSTDSDSHVEVEENTEVTERQAHVLNDLIVSFVDMHNKSMCDVNNNYGATNLNLV